MEFSNPMPPPGHQAVPDTPTRAMTNADFRKLMMTPRAAGAAAGTPAAAGARSDRGSGPTSMGPPTGKAPNSAQSTERKKKKQFYASLRKAEDDKLAELAARYRDRAKERREGAATETGAEESITATAAGYHAVAPDLKSNLNAAERRKQLIQESKFLGGDMEHTHLVKGLDYALLQKVRSEIEAKEKEENEFEEALRAKQEEKQRQDKRAKDEVEEQTKLQFRTGMAKNINRLLFAQKSSRVERNELFLPHRMAYVIELDEGEGDIPTALIRSKQDCPDTAMASTSLTTNDIVINKLTQILGYLRSGLSIRKNKKRSGVDKNAGDGADPKSKESSRTHAGPRDEVSIFDDVGVYQPQKDSNSSSRRPRRDSSSRSSPSRDSRSDRDRTREHRGESRSDRRDGDKKSSSGSRYFSGSATEEAETDKTFDATQSDALLRTALKATQQAEGGPKEGGGRFKEKLARLTQQEDYYSECYPGMPENDDAVVDSDEEEDLSKMDNGKRKGPLNRWDFESQEEYAAYMDRKEALPKAAFQYGVKMAEGRKTKGTGNRAAVGPQGQMQGQKKDKMKLDRELQQINQILAKRRAGEGSGSGGKQGRYED